MEVSQNRLILFVVCCFLSVSSAAQENMYDVGYKALQLTDTSRQENSPNSYLPQSENIERYRSLMLHVWFPTQKGQNQRRMSDKVYHEQLEEFQRGKKLSREERAALERRLLARLANANPNIDKVYNEETGALLRVDPLNIKTPLIIHSGHVVATRRLNERLAKSGYIVVAIDALSEPHSIVSAVDDLIFALRTVYSDKSFNISKTIGMGSGYGGENILALQLHTGILDGIISFDGSEHWSNRLTNMSDSFPLSYTISKMNIPYIRLYDHVDRLADPNFSTTLKYSEQYILDIDLEGVTHGTWQYPHAISSYKDDKSQNNSIAMMQLQLSATNAFINNNDMETREYRLSELSSVENITYSHYSALKPPPNRREYVRLMDKLGKAGFKQLIEENLKKDPDFIDYQSLYLTGRDRTWSDAIEEGKPYIELAMHFYPSELGPYFELLRLSFEAKDQEANKRVQETYDMAVKNGVLSPSERAISAIDRYRLP